MDNVKRVCAAGVSAVLLLSGLAGCSGGSQPAEETGVKDACQEIYGLPGDTVVATVNGQDLLLSQISYWLAYNANMLGAYYYGSLDAINWDDPYTEEQTVAEFVKEDALNVAVNYMVLEQKSKELGIDPTEEQTAAVDETMNSYITSFGQTMWDNAVADGTVVEADYDEDAKNAWIQENGAADMENEVAVYGTTTDYLRYMAEVYQLYADIQDYYFPADSVTDEVMAQYVKDNLVYSAKSVLFQNTTDAEGNTVAYKDMDDDQKAALKAEAQAALDEILAAEDPEAKLEEYQESRNDDPGSASAGAFYTFMDGDMVDEYTTGVAALEEGQIGAQLVESPDFGYFIVMRLPVDYDSVPIAYSSYNYSLKDLYVSQSFGDMITEWNESAEVVTKDDYTNMDMASFAANLAALGEKLYPTETAEETGTPETETPAETPAAN